MWYLRIRLCKSMLTVTKDVKISATLPSIRVGGAMTLVGRHLVGKATLASVTNIRCYFCWQDRQAMGGLLEHTLELC